MIDEQTVALVAILVTLLGLLLATQNNAKQLNVQSFIKLTERFKSIEDNMPLEVLGVWRTRRLNNPPSFESTEELRNSLIEYSHLCSQEFHLFVNGHISLGIWSIWENEIEQNFRGWLLRREWPAIESEFEGYSKFHQYINDIQNNSGHRMADKKCEGIHRCSVILKRYLKLN